MTAGPREASWSGSAAQSDAKSSRRPSAEMAFAVRFPTYNSRCFFVARPWAGSSSDDAAGSSAGAPPAVSSAACAATPSAVVAGADVASQRDAFLRRTSGDDDGLGLRRRRRLLCFRRWRRPRSRLALRLAAAGYALAFASGVSLLLLTTSAILRPCVVGVPALLPGLAFACAWGLGTGVPALAARSEAAAPLLRLYVCGWLGALYAVQLATEFGWRAPDALAALGLAGVPWLASSASSPCEVSHDGYAQCDALYASQAACLLALLGWSALTSGAGRPSRRRGAALCPALLDAAAYALSGPHLAATRPSLAEPLLGQDESA